MAKQNVGFGERHLEKFVLGATGGILVAIVFLYVVQDPYSVDVSGTSMGPTVFYPKLDEQAAQALSSLKNPGEKKLPIWEKPDLGRRIPTEVAVVTAPINPPVPRLGGDIDTGGKLSLVGILSPGKPAATSGRAYTTLPTPQIRQVERADQRSAGSEVQTAAPADYSWAAVFASVPRGAQAEAFRKGGYAVDLRLLIVTEVQAERQRLLPNGEWGETEQLKDGTEKFASAILEGRDAVRLLQQNGAPFIPEPEYGFIRAYKTEAVPLQPDILRPLFQSSLPPESQLEWSVPKSMPGRVSYDWVEDYQVAVPAPSAAAGNAPGGRFDYKKAKAEVDALIAEGKFSEAEERLRLAAENPGILPRDRGEAQELLENIAVRAQEQREREEAERARRQAAEEATLGPDVDLLWFTDISARPGETYRYRVRLMALNLYAGLIRFLRNAEDAAKVVVAGDWSEWSDPVSVKPDKYLFCMGADQNSVKVELNQWSRGEWDKTNQVVSLGQSTEFQERFKDFRYDGVIAAVEPPVQFRERIVGRNGIRYRDSRETEAVVLVRSDGQVEEHLVLQDVGERRDLTDMFTPPREAQPRPLITPRRSTPRGYAPPRDRYPEERRRRSRDEG